MASLARRLPWLVIALGLPLSAACATPYWNRLNPDFGAIEFDRDLRECRGADSPGARPVGRFQRARIQAEDGLVWSCMKERGWQSGPSAGPTATPPR